MRFFNTFYITTNKYAYVALMKDEIDSVVLDEHEMVDPLGLFENEHREIDHWKTCELRAIVVEYFDGRDQRTLVN